VVLLGGVEDFSGRLNGACRDPPRAAQHLPGVGQLGLIDHAGRLGKLPIGAGGRGAQGPDPLGYDVYRQGQLSVLLLEEQCSDAKFGPVTFQW
jgi:hypothetical protein